MKSIIDRKKSATTVITASRRWATPTAAALTDLLHPELAAGETLPDLELVQKLLGRALARRWDRLQASDQAHLSTLERRRLSLAERGAAMRALYAGVGGLRTLLRGIFGAPAARRLLGFAGRTSCDPVVLLRQAERTLARLRDAPPPAAGIKSSARDRARWGAPVKAAARTLETARARASIAGKRLEAATAERRRALEDFNTTFVKVAGCLAGIYRATGRADRAQVVRPCGRRPGLLLADGHRRAAPEPAKEMPVSTHRQAAAEPRSPEASRAAA